MATPAVVIAPASPWAHAQEDSVVEIARPVETNRCAGVWGIVVVAVGTNGWNTYVNRNLRISLWHQCQGPEQRCSTE